MYPLARRGHHGVRMASARPGLRVEEYTVVFVGGGRVGLVCLVGPSPPAQATALPSDCGRSLVLLTRRYRRTPPAAGDHVYVQPSATIPISLWNYTNPKNVEATFALGQADGRAWLANQAP